MLTKPHVSLLNQSVVIAGLVCRDNLSYPLTNIVSLMLLDGIMGILISQRLKRVVLTPHFVPTKI